VSSDILLTVIDFETTGSVRGFRNEPWQIGMVQFVNGRLMAERQFMSYLRVDSERPFNVYAPGRHAQLRSELAVAPTLSELWGQVSSWLCVDYLVAHNIGTERGVLAHAYPMHRVKGWIDTLKLARIAFPELESHRLEDLVVGLGLKGRLERLFPDLLAHDALYDAAASGFLLEYLLALPAWQGVSLASLAKARPVQYHKIRRK